MTKIKGVAVLAVAGILAIFAIGYYFVVSPQKAKVAKIHTNVATQQTANVALQGQLARLKQEHAKVPAEQARIAAIESRIPTSPALPGYVRFLNTAAAGSHVELVSVAPSSPTPVTMTATPIAAPASAAPANGAADNGSAATPAPPASASALTSITVTLTVVGGYFAVQQFLKQLEDSSRATVVSSVAMTPGVLPQPTGTTAVGNAATASYRTLQTQITATIFMSSIPAAATAGGQAGTAPAGTVPAGTVPTPAAQVAPSTSSNN